MFTLYYCSFFLAYVAGSVDGAVALKHLDRGTDRDLGLVLILSSISLVVFIFLYNMIKNRAWKATLLWKKTISYILRRYINCNSILIIFFHKPYHFLLTWSIVFFCIHVKPFRIYSWFSIHISCKRTNQNQYKLYNIKFGHLRGRGNKVSPWRK